MNSMMSISHRLFAAALADVREAKKARPATGRPATINLDYQGVTPAWSNGQPKPTHPSILSGVWLGGAQK
jgi:hypothetical protein